ncbi:ATP-binding cassette domain-containing protein [Synechococcus sp. H55.7]|uniref:ABC transporter ATP-binding protein n=1 Tax=unclassified Synechococcus TaxID=2626047 RepID=UPI0039C3421E
MSTLEFERVSLRFPHSSRPAVEECSFSVASGQLVVILGPSGCGKTTLLKMVNRLLEPAQGQIRLDGQDIRHFPVTALRQRIGYVIQQVGLFPHMTVAQNVAVVPRLLGWPRERIRERVDELLSLVNLPPQEYRRRYPAQLSGGQQQRVGLARALAGDPDLLLMDEPFGALDAITRSKLQDEILRLQRRLRKTILFVSHDVEEALRLADRILVMQQGRVVQFDTPFRLLTQPATPFVRELLGADDMVRQLSVLRVETAMERIPHNHQIQEGAVVKPHETLRRALSLLLRTGAAALTVWEDGRAIGIVTLDHIRHLAMLEGGSA